MCKLQHVRVLFQIQCDSIRSDTNYGLFTDSKSIAWSNIKEMAGEMESYMVLASIVIFIMPLVTEVCLLVFYSVQTELLKPATHLAILYPDRGVFDRQRKSQVIFATDWCGHTWRFFSPNAAMW